MNIIIIGGGRIGKDLARLLSSEGNDVVIIEKEEKVAEQLAGELDVLVIKGDGTNLETLREANCATAQAFCAVTGDDNTNLIAAQVAKNAFSVQRIITRINDPRNEELFAVLGLGIESMFSATRTISTGIKNMVSGTKTLLSVAGDKAELIEIHVEDLSYAVGKGVKSILPKGCIPISVLRGINIMIPYKDILLLPGDRVTALVRTGSLREFTRLFSGRKLVQQP